MENDLSGVRSQVPKKKTRNEEQRNHRNIHHPTQATNTCAGRSYIVSCGVLLIFNLWSCVLLFCAWEPNLVLLFPIG